MTGLAVAPRWASRNSLQHARAGMRDLFAAYGNNLSVVILLIPETSPRSWDWACGYLRVRWGLRNEELGGSDAHEDSTSLLCYT